MADHNLEEKIETGFRGVNARLDTLDGRVGALDGRVNARIDTLDKSVAARLDTLDGRVGALDGSVNARIDTLDKSVAARLDTLDNGFANLRTDVGELKAHLDEVRDALLADNVKTRDFVSIKVEALRTEVKVNADGVIAHTGKLENHEERITKLETR